MHDFCVCYTFDILFDIFRTWTDVWDVLSKECREKVVLIDADSLLDTLETYLRKHRWVSAELVLFLQLF